VGADGRVYATACCTPSGKFAVLAVTTKGVVSTYVPPSGDGMNDGVVLGPDGNIWFSEHSHVSNVRPDGTITEYKVALPYGMYANTAFGIGSVAGRVWFTINNDVSSPYNGFVVGVEPKTGKMTRTEVPCFDPSPVVGAAGAVWAGCGYPFSPRVDILRMTPAGVSTVYHNPDWINYSGANSLVAASQNLWFITSSKSRNPNRLDAFNLTTHQIVGYPGPLQPVTLSGLVDAPDRHIWANCFDNSYPAAANFYRH
jgi:streptogramin lyase